MFCVEWELIEFGEFVSEWELELVVWESMVLWGELGAAWRGGEEGLEAEEGRTVAPIMAVVGCVTGALIMMVLGRGLV